MSLCSTPRDTREPRGLEDDPAGANRYILRAWSTQFSQIQEQPREGGRVQESVTLCTRPAAPKARDSPESPSRVSVVRDSPQVRDPVTYVLEPVRETAEVARPSRGLGSDLRRRCSSHPGGIAPDGSSCIQPTSAYGSFVKFLGRPGHRSARQVIHKCTNESSHIHMGHSGCAVTHTHLT
ncbi:hypothetical protein FKM82_029946 [Ascaphus truei]